MNTTEHHISVARTARYYTAGALEGRASDVWFLCHGYAQLARDFIGSFAGFENRSRLMIAPEALSRAYVRGSSNVVGASWMTREDRLHEIDDYVRYLDALHTAVTAASATDAHVTALGFSQGTATAGRWLALGSARIDRLILYGGLLPPDLPEASWRRFEGVGVTYVVGTEDVLVNRTELQEQLAALDARGIAANLVEFPGGHVVSPDALAALAPR